MSSIPDFVTLLSLLVGLVGIGLAISSEQRQKAMQKELQVYKKNPVSLDEEFQAVAKLAKQIREAWKPQLIIGVNPGGAHVAEWLAVRFLGTRQAPVPFCGIWIEAERHDEGGLKAGPPEVAWHPKLLVRKADAHERNQSLESFCSTTARVPRAEDGSKLRILLVNDVSRSGRTLAAAHTFVMRELGADSIDLKTANIFEREGTLAVPADRHFSAEVVPDVRAFHWKL